MGVISSVCSEDNFRWSHGRRLIGYFTQWQAEYSEDWMFGCGGEFNRDSSIQKHELDLTHVR